VELATSDGTTAEAENHTDIAATWQSAMIATDAAWSRRRASRRHAVATSWEA
jgi:hypothetical protein